MYDDAHGVANVRPNPQTTPAEAEVLPSRRLEPADLDRVARNLRALAARRGGGEDTGPETARAG